jgi:hypothetical protein
MTLSEPLTGAALIAKVEEMPGASKSELVRACGYVSAKKEGGERRNFTAFYKAMVVAQGTPLPQGDAPLPQGDAGGGGRKLSYTTTVLTTGVLIGKRYVELLGLKPGDKLRIMVTQDEISVVPS